MTANRTFAVHSLDHARLSARKFAQQHVFPHISAAFPIWRPRMFLSSAIHDKPPREAGCHRAAFSRNRRKQMRRQGRWDSRRQESGRGRRGGSGNAAEAHVTWGDGGGYPTARRGAWRRDGCQRALVGHPPGASEKDPGKPGRAPGHRLATTEPESSPCPAALAPRTCASKTYVDCHVAGCPYPVESAHPSRKEAP